MSALMKRASRAGVAVEALADAHDSDDPHATITALLWDAERAAEPGESGPAPAWARVCSVVVPAVAYYLTSAPVRPSARHPTQSAGDRGTIHSQLNSDASLSAGARRTSP